MPLHRDVDQDVVGKDWRSLRSVFIAIAVSVSNWYMTLFGMKSGLKIICEEDLFI